MPYMKQQFIANWQPNATGATGILDSPVFRVPYPVIIESVSAHVEGTATGVTVTLLKNASAVSSGLLCTTSTWASKSFTTGLTGAKDDSFGFKVTDGGQLSKGLTGNLAVQVNVKVDQWYTHMGD